jgi:signal transduction histidine kinase
MIERLAFERRGAPDVPEEKALRRVGDALADALVGTRAGRVVWATRRLAELAAEPDVTAFLGCPFPAIFEDSGEGLPNDDAPEAVSCRLRFDAGEPVPVSVRCLFGAGSESPDRIWLVRDESRLRTLEAELLRASRELHAANREVATLRERLRRERDDREELLTVVSHELRTPATVILGYAKLLLSGRVGELNADQRRFIDETRKSGERLNRFIEDLLESARCLSGEPVLEVCERSVLPTVRSVANMLKPLLDERRLELRIDCADPCRARFDPARIEQVLTNLVGNAIKFSAEGGTIEVGARETSRADESFVEIEVCDGGPGVEDADRERIFEPYVRAGETRGAGGLGLGLAIARRIVESHGGSIACLPREGGGSRFVFTVPAASEGE